MLAESEALKYMRTAVSGVVIKASARYKNLYLFRVEFPSAEEKDYDPFFSVDISTGEVRDFSVLTDGKLSEIVALPWKDL